MKFRHEKLDVYQKAIEFLGLAFGFIKEMPKVLGRGVREKEAYSKADGMARSMGLTIQDISRLPKYLSGGQQQRAAIARALITRPPIILADEPTGNLDQETSEKITTLLQKICYECKCTVIMVSHDEQMAQKYGDIIFRLRNGMLDQEKFLEGDERE